MQTVSYPTAIINQFELIQILHQIDFKSNSFIPCALTQTERETFKQHQNLTVIA